MRPPKLKRYENAGIAGNCGNPIARMKDSHNCFEKSSRKKLDFSTIPWKTEVFHIFTTPITPQPLLKCGKLELPGQLESMINREFTTFQQLFGVLSKKTIIKKIKIIKKVKRNPSIQRLNGPFCQKLSFLVTIILPKNDPLRMRLSRPQKAHFTCFWAKNGVKCLTISFTARAFNDEPLKAIVKPVINGFIVKNRPKQQKSTIKN